ncbi:hypothetical protein AMAG_14862 [Allomyces macrogynus ATCC 38327]|uniref:TAFII28-like protein domain-containing protein n=1 Tax=Allomyces macrogynus (strain ATCC 38327) TaxID=578462 RepID=A0A0L0T5K9_ALLM3|nr:hypothetical protein AMAG_14862 [Allomyces macrogynus ATCC 38327]|eukprot:KNE70027.1 hypothetical protein AMAG_14862 [Allomyces macrogynus ATCC 38327]
MATPVPRSRTSTAPGDADNGDGVSPALVNTDARRGPSNPTTSTDPAAPAAPSTPTVHLAYRADESLLHDMIEHLCSPDQRDRYYAYRRIKFPHAPVKRLMTQATGGANAPNKHMPMVVAAVTRTYLSQVLDEARAAMRDAGKDPRGTLRVEDLREGYRRYRAKQGVHALQTPYAGTLGKRRRF